jgi:hypothetical protein
MRKKGAICYYLILSLLCFNVARAEVFIILKETLKDKIKGGWAGKTIGIFA